MRWVGRFVSECLLIAEHSFVLENIDSGKTKLTHSETFSGALTYTMGKQQRDNIQKGFELMNESLSERVVINNQGELT